MLQYWFPAGDSFPMGYLTASGDIADCQKGMGAFWVGAKDPANHLTLHKMAPSTKDYPPSNSNSNEVEKPCVIPVEPYRDGKEANPQDLCE